MHLLIVNNFLKIDFANDSKLQIIENQAFFSSSIERIKIPSNLLKIGKNAFSFCQNLQKLQSLEKVLLQNVKNFNKLNLLMIQNFIQ